MDHKKCNPWRALVTVLLLYFIASLPLLKSSTVVGTVISSLCILFLEVKKNPSTYSYNSKNIRKLESLTFDFCLTNYPIALILMTIRVIKNLNFTRLYLKKQIVFVNETNENDLSLIEINWKYVEKCVLLHIRENTPALAPISILWITSWGLNRLALSSSRYVLMV